MSGAMGMAYGLPFRRGALLGTLPLRLGALQWLSEASAPSTIVDKTANALDADCVESNCVVLDGLIDRCNTGITLTSLKTCSFWFSTETVATYSSLLAQRTAFTDPDSFSITMVNGKVRCNYGSDAPTTGTTLAYNDGVPHYLELNITNGTFTIDGGDETPIETTTTLGAGFGLLIGARHNGSPGAFSDFYQGKIWAVTVNGATLSESFYYPMAGGLGMGLDEPDVSGNGNDGTWTVGAGGVATLRSGLQNVFHYNTLNGCSKVLSFNGTSSYGSTTFDSYLSKTISADLIIEDSGQSSVIWAFGNSIGRLWVQFDISPTFRVSANTSTSINAAPYVGVKHNYAVDINGAGLVTEFRIDGNTVWTGTSDAGASGFVDDYLRFGGRQSLVDASVGAFAEMKLITASVGGVSDWYTKDAYDNGTNIIMPDSTGTNDATGTNVAEKYIPALDAGTDDVEGLGLTNPAVTGNKIHNNSEAKLVDKASSVALLDNPSLSADGITFDAKSFVDMRTHPNYENNVIYCSDASAIYFRLVWPQAYGWTPNNYTLMNTYLTGQGCTGTALIPYPVTAPTGIGPTGEWYNYDESNFYFVEDL